MPTSLRIELFPSDLQRSIGFYSNILGFALLKLKGNYAYLGRDAIFIGAIEATSSETIEEQARYRQPTKGVETVLEVDDLKRERDSIMGKCWKLDADIHSQPRGLRDFRLIDPDGYYLRITTHRPRRDGTGLAEP
ncbi:uncharacterized protein A1O9_02990 [Exophiala aquamarina CBS 119918]|uniref:VOC domain-containing protein n=1 Tax=Exophiala aquamarina CBS 119918 TaxID=1182545 RepID=A0A072PMW7_9EURO|nr:uncharacterized protein A1O9_02990 [Exophiala aquamarina CBS 119918]KEF61424.1 hypothetical protein A1O9_02990 [Exophiala aquamarina CBS 119918]